MLKRILFYSKPWQMFLNASEYLLNFWLSSEKHGSN